MIRNVLVWLVIIPYVLCIMGAMGLLVVADWLGCVDEEVL